MSDVFISYASADRAKAECLAAIIEGHGWSCWWDRRISPGRHFDKEIELALQAAKCAIVMWSEASVRSDWVRAEATDAAERDILIPVMIETIRPPLAFRNIQAVLLVGWNGASTDTRLSKLSNAITELIVSPRGAGSSLSTAGGLAITQYAPSPHSIQKRIRDDFLVRSLLSHKFSVELETAFIFDRIKFLAELCDARARLKESDAITDYSSDVRLPAEDWQLGKELITSDKLRTFARELAAYGPISVNVSAINVTTVSVFMSLQNRFADCGLSFHLDFKYANGREQMRSIQNGDQCDFLVAPIDDFFLVEFGGNTSYRMLGPLNGEDQCVFRKKSSFTRRNTLCYTLGHSAAEMNVRLGVGVPRSSTQESIPDSRKIPHLIGDIAGGDYVIAWDPYTQLLRTDHRYDEIPGSRYCVTYFLFCHKSWRHSTMNRLRNAFKVLFENEWWYCRKHREKVLAVVRRNRDFMEHFADSAGLNWISELKS